MILTRHRLCLIAITLTTKRFNKYLMTFFITKIFNHYEACTFLFVIMNYCNHFSVNRCCKARDIYCKSNPPLERLILRCSMKKSFFNLRFIHSISCCSSSFGSDLHIKLINSSYFQINSKLNIHICHNDF